MMIYFFYFPFFFTFLFMVAKLMKETKAKNSTSKLPPGPRKVPVIGNIHQLIGSRPHRTLRDLAKKYGPLMHLRLGEVFTIVVSSPEMAKKIMKDHDIVFASRPSLLAVRIMTYNGSDILFAPYGNYWRNLRKILTMELLGASRVQLFRSVREEEVSNLIRSISSYDGLPINLSERIFSTNYGITSKAAFGKKCSVQDQEDFISVAKETGKLASGFRVADFYPSIKLLETISGVRPKCEKQFRKMDRILQKIINEHRGRHGEAEEDIVDVLLKLQQQDNLQFPLTDENIKAVIAEIFAAGSETSSTAIEWAMSEMLKHPGIMKEAQNEVRNAFHGKGTVDEVRVEELKLLKSIIKETLRLHPPAPFLLPRECGMICIYANKVARTVIVHLQNTTLLHQSLCCIIMVLQLVQLQSLFTFIAFLFLVVTIFKASKTRTSNPKSPPGPWKLPLIGNLHQLSDPTPHRSLANLAKKYGPLMHLKLGAVPAFVISSPEIAEEVMKTHDINFAQRPYLLVAHILSYGSTNIVFAPYGDYWRLIRKVCSIRLLSAKRVQSFQSLREEEVSNFIELIYSSKGSPINLSNKISALSFGLTSRAAFGKKCKDQEAFLSIVTEATRLAAGFSIADAYPSIRVLETISGMRPKLEKMLQKTDKILEKIVKEHKERGRRRSDDDGEAEIDLVDVLLELQEQGDLDFTLSDENIKAVLLDMFSGGSDTSSATVVWAMSEMVKNPSVMEKAQVEVRKVFDGKRNVEEAQIHELKYLKSVIKETLRLHPPIPLIPRECRESCCISGYQIPVRAKVTVNTWAIGRDPRYWSEAERFYPERFLDSSVDFKGTDFGYIPFGAGRRICPGISFALHNIELPLAQLLYHFDWELPNGMKHQDMGMSEDSGAACRRKEDLVVIPIPCHSFHVK
ncbi:p450 domain-containing protein [Cephalotus follicularis]|uniref:p450 domain-containing protein n=1 Tax=Cephalotus follicularis TaxID=3775 RepID=A0A1Q3CX58_CEPFO|nr:p450 domain-containing protein [Cephalotus follicularis]